MMQKAVYYLFTVLVIILAIVSSIYSKKISIDCYYWINQGMPIHIQDVADLLSFLYIFVCYFFFYYDYKYFKN